MAYVIAHDIEHERVDGSKFVKRHYFRKCDPNGIKVYAPKITDAKVFATKQDAKIYIKDHLRDDLMILPFDT